MKLNASFKILIERLFQQEKHPEKLYKSCDGLLRLARSTNEETLEKACQIALEHRRYNYGFLKNIIANKMVDEDLTISPKPLPRHSNLRGSSYYQQSINFKKDEPN
jgi:hypothetical protein